MSQSAFQTALKILSRRDHFVAELREKLVQKSFELDEIDEALDRCAEIGLLDDERIAHRFVELRAVQRGWGPYRLQAELRKRGADDALAASAARLQPGDLTRALDTAIRKTEVRAADGWWRLPDRRARMVSSLIARGFEANDVIVAVDELADAREKTHDALDDQ